MENPWITTIIPTYKRPALLKRALSSVVNQTYPHLRILVCDNASGDETESIVREFASKDSRVIYHQHPENIGMMGNYLFGLSQVQTPLFSILSDDDVLFPWFYETLLEAHSKFPDAVFYAGSTIIMSPKGEVVRVPLELWNKEGYFPAGEALSEMINKYPVPTCVLFQKKIIEMIPIDTTNTLVWDCDFLVSAALRFPIFTTKHPCGIFLHHSSSFSNGQEAGLWLRSFDQITSRVKSNPQIAEENRKVASQLLDAGSQEMLSGHIIYYLMNKKFAQAVQTSKLFRDRFGPSFRSYLFLTVAQVCKFFPPSFALLACARMLKRLFKKKLSSRFEQYATWL